MKTYEKPLVMVNNDLAEGVYAASHQGNTVTFTWYKAPTSACVIAQVAKDVEKLSVASISISAD